MGEIRLGGTARPVAVKVPRKNSFHPDRRALRGDDSSRPKKAVDVASFVGTLKGSLTKIEAELRENDPKALKADIAKLQSEKAALERQAAAAAKAAPASPDELRAAEQGGYETGYSRGHLAGFSDGLVRGWSAARQRGFDAITVALPDEPPQEIREIPAGSPAPADPRREGPAQAVRDRPAVSGAVASAPGPKPNGAVPGALTPPLQRVVNAIAWWRKIGFDPVERARACVVAGYSPKASTFGVYIADLVGRGLVATPAPGKVSLTEAGLAIADVPQAGTQEELRAMARELLKPAEARAFDAVYASWPNPIRRDAVAEALGLSPTASTAGVYIASVASFGIIEPAGPGQVRAADWLFPEAR